MSLVDMEKTMSTTPRGTFYYKVTPFRLKNFGGNVPKGNGDSLDDMIAKSQIEEDHIANFQKLFDRLRKFKLHLNPIKCSFVVRSGILFGFIIKKRGINGYPDKVRAIQDIPAPRIEKEVRGFLGRLNYIARFISHLTSTCELIFKLLRKD